MQPDVTDRPHPSVQKRHPEQGFASRHAFATHLIISLVLAAAALIPRILLALRLDMVTDEIVYIPVGKLYWSLLHHVNMVSVDWQSNYEHPPW